MVVLARNPGEKIQAEHLPLTYPVVSEKPVNDYYLGLIEGRWAVLHSGKGERFHLQPDLSQEFSRLQRQRLNPKKDLLGRALGFKGDDSFLVWDGTLGFGKDSLHMLALGFEVLSFERHPLVHFLMSQALGQVPELAKRWQLRLADVSQCLDEAPENLGALYLDPMFETADKKSAAKKNMEFLRDLVEPGEVGHALVAAALDSKVRRVVVKRPQGSDPLVKKPTNQVPGRLIRYDIYHKHY